MAQIKITTDLSQVRKFMDSLSQSKLDNVFKQAIRRALASAKTHIGKEVAAKYYLKQSDIKRKIHTKKAQGTPPQGSVTVYPVPIPVDKFSSVRPSAGGLVAKIEKSGGKNLLRHSFFANVKGKKMAFVRTRVIDESTRPYIVKPAQGGSRRSPKGAELPINRMFVDPITGVIIEREEYIREKASEAGQKALVHAVNRALRIE